MSAFDDLARALDAARRAHEARPDDRERERRFLAARADFLEAENRQLRADLSEARGRLRADLLTPKRNFEARIRAVTPAKRPARRRRAAGGALPLLERMV